LLMGRIRRLRRFLLLEKNFRKKSKNGFTRKRDKMVHFFISQIANLEHGTQRT
jgi:hypothetical protein